MMKRKIALKTLFSVVLGIGIVSAAVEDANMHMDKLSEIFSKYSLDGFKIVTGHDFGGTGGSGGMKTAQQSARSEIAATTHYKDPRDYMVCAKNGIWAAHQREPMKVGKSAMTLTDAHGNPVLPLLIDSVKRLEDGTVKSGGKANVPVTMKENGNMVNYTAVVRGSEFLLGRKNPTGEKFLCAMFTRSE